MAVQAAKLIDQRSHIVPGKIKITDYFFDVPTDYSDPNSRTLRLFARAAARHNVPVAHKTADSKDEPAPAYMLYLQGGPGFECRLPQQFSFTNNLIDRGYTVVFLDQRGTGLSTAVYSSTLGLRGDDPVQAKYLSHFRADNIVRDAEAVRLALTANTADAESRKWSLIGQSFGGFCSTTYLSLFPDSLREVFVTGGLPPITQKTPDEIYRRLFRKVSARNKAYYAKFPEDIARVRKILQHTQRHGAGSLKLPSQGILSPQRFLALGLHGLGMHGGFEDMHAVVTRCTADLDQFGHLTRSTASMIDASAGFDNNPLYCLLQESIYCQGAASAWSAARVMAEYPEFDVEAGLAAGEDTPVYFTGEQAFPWMLDSFAELKRLSGPANLIAEKADWPALYDLEQLKKNTVPMYAMVYVDDLYVDLDFSLETAGLIGNCKAHIVNRMYHDAIRTKEEEVIKTLFAMRDDVID